MTSRVKERSQASPHAPIMTKAERRAAGRLAKAKRRAAAKRRLWLRRLGGVAVVVAIGVGLAAIFGAFSGDKPSAITNAPAWIPLPADADAALVTKPTVTAGSEPLDQLAVTTLVAGKGSVVSVGQQVTVNYVGVTYQTGAEFDSSWASQRPFVFTVGAGNVIKGWDQGLLGVTVGSRVQLDIPANLAYGDNPAGGQPAGALRFVVDVLAAQDAGSA